MSANATAVMGGGRTLTSSGLPATPETETATLTSSGHHQLLLWTSNSGNGASGA